MEKKGIIKLSEILTGEELINVILEMQRQLGISYAAYMIDVTQEPAKLIYSGFEWSDSIKGEKYWQSLIDKVLNAAE